MGVADDDRERRRQYGIWAAMQKSSMRTRTDSDIDLRASNMAVGVSRIFEQKGGELLFSPFVEYATGKYDSYMGDGTHGGGELSYLGTGVLARMDRTNGAWVEAALHGGSTKANYRGQVYASRVTTYRYTAPYWAMQLGVGKTRTVGSAAQLDCYVRYFWSHTNGVSARLNSGETYDFQATDSHRLRAGARYTRHSAASALYAGLALEYEMGNGAAAHFQSYDLPASAAAGASVLMELGWRSVPKHGRPAKSTYPAARDGGADGWAVPISIGNSERRLHTKSGGGSAKQSEGRVAQRYFVLCGTPFLCVARVQERTVKFSCFILNSFLPAPT